MPLCSVDDQRTFAKQYKALKHCQSNRHTPTCIHTSKHTHTHTHTLTHTHAHTPCTSKLWNNTRKHRAPEENISVTHERTNNACSFGKCIIKISATRRTVVLKPQYAHMYIRGYTYSVRVRTSNPVFRIKLRKCTQAVWELELRQDTWYDERNVWQAFTINVWYQRTATE